METLEHLVDDKLADVFAAVNPALASCLDAIARDRNRRRADDAVRRIAAKYADRAPLTVGGIDAYWQRLRREQNAEAAHMARAASDRIVYEDDGNILYNTR